MNFNISLPLVCCSLQSQNIINYCRSLLSILRQIYEFLFTYFNIVLSCISWQQFFRRFILFKFNFYIWIVFFCSLNSLILFFLFIHFMFQFILFRSSKYSFQPTKILVFVNFLYNKKKKEEKPTHVIFIEFLLPTILCWSVCLCVQYTKRFSINWHSCGFLPLDFR